VGAASVEPGSREEFGGNTLDDGDGVVDEVDS
jgi:hypothetical protein